MPKKKKTNKKGNVAFGDMAKKNIVITWSLERQDWQKQLMIIGLQ
jgi:hypothetical protein